MKNIKIIILALIAPLAAFGQGINFEHDGFDAALAKAKAEDKLLFIDGYADWCGPCKKMAATVFLEEEVGTYFDEHLIALKVNVELGEGPNIKRKYGIEGLPGYVFIDGEDNVVYRFSAAMPTDKFMNEVKLAVKYAKDPNSVGRLAERYEKEKGDEAFLKTYLDKLTFTKSTNYTDILEQYLSIQTTLKEDSKEMVVLLADHSEQIIIGGKADEIIQRNYGSDAWKLYVRKDVRQKYQDLKKKIIQTTTNYAIEKRDTTILERTFPRAAEMGMPETTEQRERTYTYYYLMTNQGEKYKALIRDKNEEYIQSIPKESYRAYYLDWKERLDRGDAKARGTRPHSIRTSDQIKYIVSSYSKFVRTEQDKQDVLSWMEVANYILPNDAMTMSMYADVLYMFGDDKEKALQMKEEAYQLAVAADDKKVKNIEAILLIMREGKPIRLQ